MRARRALPLPARLLGLTLGVVVFVAVAVAAWGAVDSGGLATGTPGVSIIAQNGFGDHNNSYAWGMGWFDGKLYVGTGRDELCVENETVQFYFPADHSYSIDPSPNVHCPADPYHMDLRAEIWQYTPPSAHSGGRWRMVYRSGTIPNPAVRSGSVARDIAYRGMVSWKNPQGRRAMFVSGVSADEYLPPLLRSHPPVLLRTFDGVHWQVLHLPSVVVNFPNGRARPMGFRSLVVWDHHLFVTATPDITGDGGLFEVTHPWSNHPGLRQVSGPQYDIFEISTFDGALYIGTGDNHVGYGVYRAFTYRSHGFLRFHQVVGDGAGRGNQVTSVVSMHVYRNRLYVGASGWYNQGTLPVSELIRIAPDGEWQLVVGNPRSLPNGRTMYPVSGLYDGFFSPFAAHFWRMAQQGGGLFVSTNDWAYAIQQDKRYAWLQETVLSGVLGFNLWATCDGNDWFAVTRDAFTGDEYNFGGRNLVTGGQTLYIGTANQAQGTTIFADRADACGSLVNGTRSSPGSPRGLMTESLRHGTFLSWQPAAHGTSYVIERAPLVNVKMGLTPPATLPNGWQFDDAVPGVTAPGAPGSVTVTLSVPGGFTPVGTTSSTSFVDHASGRAVYEVMARAASGAISAPSNAEIGPISGPPATFADLRSTVEAPPTGGPQARTAAARLQGLLAAAERASARGDYALARRDVARVQSAAGNDDVLANIAARVQRRLQYVRIAGAP